MNEVINNILTRRSVRSYEERQVPNELLDQILEAGLYAASGRGLQSPVVLVIQDKAVIKELSKINASIFGRTGDPFFGAPTILMVLTERERSTGVEDASLVIGNMMLAAHSLRLGTCWVHRAKEETDVEYVKKMLKGVGINPEQYVGVGHLSLGYPKLVPPKGAPRKPNRVFKIG